MPSPPCIKRRRLFLCSIAICLIPWLGWPQSVAAQDEKPVSELIFPLNAEFNNAPGIVEFEDGSLLVSWYRGSVERRVDDMRVLGARRKHGETEWGEPFLMVDTPGFPDGNTCMHVDKRGQLMLFWPIFLTNSWDSCITQQLVSNSPLGTGCPTWSRRDSVWLKPEDFSPQALAVLDELMKNRSEPIPERFLQRVSDIRKRAPEKLYQRLGWQPRCKPITLSSGRILLPLYSDTFSISIMAISDDDGVTWQASKPLISFGNTQPSIVERQDGSVVAYMRENAYSKRIRVCESRDGGETWGPVTSSKIPNPGSGVDVIRLAEGPWVLIHNDGVQGRNRLAVSVSEDEGQSWPFKRFLEDQPNGSVHSPAMIQSRNGKLHAVYSYVVEKGKSIKHVEFNLDWIMSGF